MRYDYREMIGWEDLVNSVSDVYLILPAEEQPYTSIITGNYGEAGAINHYGPTYGLPKAVSGISSYYYWGPGNKDARTFIAVGIPGDYLGKCFSEVRLMTKIHNAYNINNEEQGQPVFLCRKPYKSIVKLWPYFKHY
jgi:hypothetical protein